MPLLPSAANPNIISNFNPWIISWTDDIEIPKKGPHTHQLEQYGCTINKDFSDIPTRSHFKKGMQGHWIGEEKNGKVKVFIRGVTESEQKGVWVENLWVPVSNVDKGKRWKPDIKDWDFKTILDDSRPKSIASLLKSTPPDTSILGKTITALLDEFLANPAPFMGTKIQDLLDKRATLQKGSDIQSLTKVIVLGIKKANVYATLNRPNFSASDLLDAASCTIDKNLQKGKGGVYLRYHYSTSEVTHWSPNTKYVYIGKTVDFRDRFDSHPASTSSYGDLTRNSNPLRSVALCIMDEQDIVDFAHLVEQVFVCLLETYRSDVLVSLSGTFSSAKGIEHVEAVQAADYFRKVSEGVFGDTHFPGGINRPSFSVSHGANYSMPMKEWGVYVEQMLFLRYDIATKSKESGDTIPIAVFRRATPKTAHYLAKTSGGNSEAFDEMCLFQKYAVKKCFFSVRHSQKVRDGTMGPRQDEHYQKVRDGTMGPRQDEHYQLVFEVRTDGKAHLFAWSRLPSIGPFQNWDEARSLAVRMEWEHPPKSGKWRYRYLFAGKVYTFKNKDEVGSHINYIKAIAMIRWLFDAKPNKPQPWMQHLTGSAYVLHTYYNYHTQTVEVRLPTPIIMRSGDFRPAASIIADMVALGLENINGAFGQKKMCDGCAMLAIKILNSLGSGCIQIPGENCCRNCKLFGRPCCSWTKNGAVRGMRAFSKGMIEGTIATEGKVTSNDVALHKKYRAGLHVQPLPDAEQEVEPFNQQLIDVVGLARLEDDLSDVEDAEEDFELGDDDDDE